MLFVRNDIPANVVSTDDWHIESFYVELNFRNKKWLLNCSYSPKHSGIESHLDSLSKSIDSLSSKYDNLRNLIKESTCFKNPENTTCIDLILTNKPLSFKNKYLIEAGLSDFHKIVVAVMKMYFPKMKPQVITYRKYKDFHNETFLDSLKHELNVQGQFLNEKGLDAFSSICTEIFDKHAPKKSDIYDLTINLSLIMKFLRQS